MSTDAKKVRKISPKVACDRLLRSAGKYLESCGGRGIIAGPISIMTYPGADPRKFYLAIEIFGRKPEKGSLA